MSPTVYIFLISLAGLVALGVSKHLNLRDGRTSPFSRFDKPLGLFLVRFSVRIHGVALSFKNGVIAFLNALSHSLTFYVHQVLQSAERRARQWREFARERKIERKPASMFLKDVFEYKNQIRNNGGGHQP